MDCAIFDVKAADICIGVLPQLVRSSPSNPSGDHEAVALLNCDSAFSKSIQLTEKEKNALSDTFACSDVVHIPRSVGLKPKKPLISSNTLVLEFKTSKNVQLLTLKHKPEHKQLVTLLHHFLTASKIKSSNMFRITPFYMKDLKLTLMDNTLLMDFRLVCLVSLCPSLFHMIPQSILVKLNELLDLIAYPDETEYQTRYSSNTSPPTVSSFYSLITSNTDKCFNGLQKKNLTIPGIEKTLLPFQVDSLQWLLSHESIKMTVDNDSFQLSKLTYPKSPTENEISEILDSLSQGWSKIRFYNNTGSTYWYNPYSGSICDSDFILDYLKSTNYVKSPAKGFLCEEMGLGKTLEITSLIKLNPKLEISNNLKYDLYNPSREIRECKTTLILCPLTIIDQWYNEIISTCPDLKVYNYKGISHIENSDLSVTPTKVAEKLSDYDVVLTSFSILTKELDRAVFIPTNRPKRKSVSSERIDYSSPLMLLEFYRLIVDEAQLASISISRVSHFSRIIPRLHTWCVSGTIIRKNLNDLHSLIKSERMYPLDQINDQIWETMPRYLFDRIFQRICIRHTKEMVGNQINLPKQRRIMLRSPFSTIENDNYYDLFNRFLSQVGLNSNGEPIAEGFDYDQSKNIMRLWSSKLRMVCCHALLAGSLNRRNIIHQTNLGSNASIKNKKSNDSKSDFMLGTLDDVLVELINNNETDAYNNFSLYIRNYIQMGKIMEFLRNPGRAVEIFEFVISEIKHKLEKFRNEVGNNEDTEKNKIWHLRIRNLMEYLHQSYFMLASAHYQHYRPMKPLPDNFTDLVEMSKEEDETKRDDVDKVEDFDIDSLNDEAKKHYFLENEYYTKADQILNQLLEEQSKKTVTIIEKLEALYKTFSMYKTADLQVLGSLEKNENSGNPEIKKVCELPLISKRFEKVIDVNQSTSLEISFILNRALESIEQLNAQSTVIDYWFKRLYEYQRIQVTNAEGKDKTGEEYSLYLISQELSQSYIDQIQLILDDREKAINSTEDSLSYSTQTSKAQRVFKSIGMKQSNAATELEEIRKKYLPQGAINPRYSLHTSILELMGELQSSLPNTTKHDYLNETVKILKFEMKDKLKNLKEMKTKIFDIFNDSFNSKVTYFKSLQIRSDSLMSYFPQKLGASPRYVGLMEFESLQKELEINQSKIRSLNARLNYLKSLNTKRELHSTYEHDDMCVICTFRILIGTLTPCGHKYCRECLKEWMKAKRICPICKKDLKVEELYNFTYSSGGLKGDVVQSMHDNKEEAVVKKEVEEDEDKLELEKLNLLKNRRIFEKDIDFVYQGLSTNELREITNISLSRSYGTKIDMIIRQIKYLVKKEGNVQILIFSQWNTFLLLLGRAMNKENVIFRSWMDQKITNTGGGKTSTVPHKLNKDISEFKKDATITCFLLNTIAQAAGLTFTNASHVFLCEPIVNLSFELQAINRIHRIGQTKETTVWNFIIEGTIEESIAYLGTKKRIQAAKVRKVVCESDTEEIEEIDDNVLEAKELTKANDISKTEGEIIGDEDLWAAFFAAKSAQIMNNVYN